MEAVVCKTLMCSYWDIVLLKDPIGNIVDAEFQTNAKDPVKVPMSYTSCEHF